MQQITSWEANWLTASQEIPRLLPEGLLPHSQVPATCLYPEPAYSSPYPHIPLPEGQSEYYSPIYAWVSLVVSFPSVSPPKFCTRLPISTTCPHHLILLDFITHTMLDEEYRPLSSLLWIFLHNEEFNDPLCLYVCKLSLKSFLLQLCLWCDFYNRSWAKFQNKLCIASGSSLPPRHPRLHSTRNSGRTPANLPPFLHDVNQQWTRRLIWLYMLWKGFFCLLQIYLFKDEMYLCYIRTQSVPRSKHYPVRL
jgi:hypothetical protein